jgi:hypothetical protein
MITPDNNPAHLNGLELEKAVEFLRGLEEGRQPYELFLEIARLAVMGSVEMVPLRTTAAGKTEVLLTQRPENDVWAEQWHVPGTIMLPTDKVESSHDYDDAFGRIFGDNGELKSGVKVIGKPVYVDSERRKTRRGDEFAAIHYAEVTGEPTIGRFFDAEAFPDNVPEPGVIHHHVEFIQEAVARYMADKQGEQE